MNRFLKQLLDLLYPPKCIFCGAVLQSGSMPSICNTCNASARRLGAKCPKCNAIPSATGEGYRCHTCHAAGRHFDAAFSVYKYDGSVRQAILRYKFQSRPETALSLSYEPSCLLSKLGFGSENIHFIACVPPDKKRLRMRGYDHIELIAREISSALSIPIHYKALEKRRQTKAQSLLSKKGRIANVKGVYGVPKGINFEGARVLLLDDVLTTGSTVNEAAKALKRAGAAYVVVCTVAYAGR